MHIGVGGIKEGGEWEGGCRARRGWRCSHGGLKAIKWSGTCKKQDKVGGRKRDELFKGEVLLEGNRLVNESMVLVDGMGLHMCGLENTLYWVGTYKWVRGWDV